MFAEQLVAAVAVWVQLSAQWLGILRETCREHDHFEMLAHAVQELSDAGPHQNINLAHLAFNFNRKNNVRIFHRFELRMDQRLIEVEHERFAPDFRFSLRAN